MPNLDETIIELSKIKIIKLLLMLFIVIGAGFWLANMDAARIESSNRFNNPFFVHGLGWVATVFGLLGCALSIKQIFDKKPGLILNVSGIVDNSSTGSAGFIPWCDIADFGVYEVRSQKLLTILLKNPDNYIEMGSSMRKFLKRASFKSCGSPILISPNTLKISFDELAKISTEYLAKYGNSA